ncbi:MAG TPA: 6-carboxytetrahydropterin synthase [Chitinophagaceae bacterium]|nr:6-carboxytetrahydropterin synthase [Chitinophagaceae bacterium]
MVYLTRIEHFNAAHKLFNPRWSREQNEEVFGKCANENWHGHNYDLHVTVKGMPDPDTGFLYDVKKLSIIIREHVIEKIDHRNLNIDVKFMEGKMCSTENLAVGIWKELEPHLPPEIRLHCIKLYETSSIYVEYYGE